MPEVAVIFAFGNLMQLVGPFVGGYTYALVPEYPALIPSLIGIALCPVLS